jgi:hypothetical protein
VGVSKLSTCVRTMFSVNCYLTKKKIKGKMGSSNHFYIKLYYDMQTLIY